MEHVRTITMEITTIARERDGEHFDPNVDALKEFWASKFEDADDFRIEVKDFILDKE